MMLRCRQTLRLGAAVRLLTMSTDSPVNLKVGLFGAGVVGGGVLDLIQKYSANGKFGALGASVEVSKICVQSLDKPRDVAPLNGTTYVTDRDEILNDPSINCVIELMGGVTTAKDVVMAAISKGKHVITANKALIANFLPEIQSALAANPTVKFSYEAAVCGGIPVINALQTDFVADDITKVMGIMNGTTNFMLSKMEDKGADYGVVLQEAQRLGFAEADPTADVEGHDVQAKIALLAKLAFGKTIPVPTVPTAGISKITAVDFAYAKIMRSTIKLLGTAIATTNEDGTRALSVFVSPTIVPLSNPLATAKGPGNMVLINSTNMGATTLAGPGAGRYPTANSVLNDIVRLSQNRVSPPFPLEADASIVIDNNYKSKFYVRIRCKDELGIIRSVGTAAEANGVSIFSILQQPMEPHASSMAFVIITDLVTLSSVQAFAQDISTASFTKEFPLFMPVL